MANARDIIQHCNELLTINQFQDYCPNGLQVEGKTKVNKIISGVTACQQLIDAAVAKKADMLLVHHGYFWKHELPQVVGMKRHRLASLLSYGINLVAYHLPLDAHPTYGNNAQLAALLGIKVKKTLDIDGQPNLFYLGELQQSQSMDAFAAVLEAKLARIPLVEACGVNKTIKKIAWCTGAAQDYLEYAIAEGCDVFLTGEVSERTIHLARENQIHFIAAGHHATERYGIQALGKYLGKKFTINHEYVEVDNPA